MRGRRARDATVDSPKRDQDRAAKAPSGIPLAEPGAGLGAVGMTYGLTVVAFTGCGWWLDGHFGTSPWLLLAGALLGGVGGFVSLLKKVPPPGGGSKGDDT